MTARRTGASRKSAATRRMTWHRGNHIAVAAQNLALPVTQFTGPDAPRSPHHAASKEREWRQRERPKMYLTSEIVNDTLAARRFRLLAPLAVLAPRGAGPGARHHWELEGNCATTVGAISAGRADPAGGRVALDRHRLF